MSGLGQLGKRTQVYGMRWKPMSGKPTAQFSAPPNQSPYAKPPNQGGSQSPGQPAAKPAAKPRPNPVYTDPGYIAETGAHQGTYDTTLAGLQNREGEIKRDFGLEDYSSPFSQARELKRQYLARNRGTDNALASAGQFLSGAHEAADRESARDEASDYDRLQRTYESLLSGVGQGRLQAASTLGSDDAISYASALERALGRGDEGNPDSTPNAVSPAELRRRLREKRQADRQQRRASSRHDRQTSAARRKKGKR